MAMVEQRRHTRPDPVYEGQLSNIEVMEMLKTRGADQAENSLSEVELQVWEYLKGTKRCTATREAAAKFLQAVEKFRLSKYEALQLLNQRPLQHVELHLLIDNCDDRFSDEEFEELLGLVKQILSQSHGNE